MESSITSKKAEVDTAAALLAFRASRVGPRQAVLLPKPKNEEQEPKRGDLATVKTELNAEESSRNQLSCVVPNVAVPNFTTPNGCSNVPAATNVSRLLSDAAGVTAAQQAMMLKGHNQAAMSQAAASSLQLGQLASFRNFAHALSPLFLPHTSVPTNQSLDLEPTVSSQHDIRKEEVEKALRSKPQRGRKRSNLNHDERQELARTRNREHAKSTRMRKKQRLGELLEIEAKYLEMMRTAQLKQARINAVRELLQHRQVQHFPPPQEVQGASKREADSPTKFDHLPSYSCFTKMPTTGQVGSASSMKHVDLALYDRARQHYGKQIQVELRYSDLALSADAESIVMMLHFHAPGHDVLLKSTWTKLVFAKDSDSITNVQETILQDFAATSDDTSALEAQASHPSVISLDDKAAPVVVVTKARSIDGEHGLFI